MKEIFFNEVNSLTYGLIPLSQEVPLFRPRIYTVEVPGMDGFYDLTDRMGITYQDAQIKLVFESFMPESEVRNTLRQINGLRLNLKIMNGKHGECYDGRVSSCSTKQNNSTVSVEVLFEASARGVTYV